MSVAPSAGDTDLLAGTPRPPGWLPGHPHLRPQHQVVTGHHIFHLMAGSSKKAGKGQWGRLLLPQASSPVPVLWVVSLSRGGVGGQTDSKAFLSRTFQERAFHKEQSKTERACSSNRARVLRSVRMHSQVGSRKGISGAPPAPQHRRVCGYLRDDMNPGAVLLLGPLHHCPAWVPQSRLGHTLRCPLSLIPGALCN